MEPLISVILPVYNIEAYLPKCMNSLFCQTYDNIEFVLVDDGSKKECAELCDSYIQKDNRVVVYHKVNGGLSDARNYGIERAKGEYITCIDPDDFVDQDYIEYLYNLIVKYNVKMSICQHRVIYDNGKIKENGQSGDSLIDNKSCIERMLYHDVVDTSAWAKLYHKSLFNTVKYPKGKIFEDIGTTYALMLQCENIGLGYESKYNYIFHNNSIVNSTFKLNKLDMLDTTDKMAKDVLSVYPDLKDAVLRRQVYARFSTLNQMLNCTEYDDIKQGLIEYIKKNKKSVLSNKKTPKRDRMAFYLLDLGFPAYKCIWTLYLNFRGTK